MAYTRVTAKKLLTETELEIFDAAKPVEIKKLTKPQLRRALERSRKLRDKYRDLFRRQRLTLRDEVGSKSGTTGDSSEFEARIAQIEAAEDKAFSKANAKKRAKA